MKRIFVFLLVCLAGTLSYGQCTSNCIDLANRTKGILPKANGGAGADQTNVTYPSGTAIIAIAPGGTTAADRIVSFNGTDGKTLKDSGILTTSIAIAPGGTTAADRVVTFNGTDGKSLKDSSKLVTDLVTGPASSTNGNLPSFNGTGGKTVQDSGIAASSVNTGPASAVSGNLPSFNGTGGKTLQDSGVASGNVVTAASNLTQYGLVVSNAASGKTTTAIAPNANTAYVLHSGGSSANPAWGAIASSDLPAVITSNTSINGTTIPSSKTLMATDTAIADAQMAAKYVIRSCEVHIWGTGTAGALQDTDDEPSSCFNGYGVTWTITHVYCLADNSSTTTTVTPIVKGGSATSILSGALTCGNNTFAEGSLNGTPTVASVGSVDANVTAHGTANSVRIVIVGTI